MLKKEDGKIIYFISSVLISFFSIMIIFNYKINEIEQCNNYIENNLMASVLAAATVDLNVLGSEDRVVNTDFDKSYNDFIYSLKDNLSLDSNFNVTKKSLIENEINIDSFMIYNVNGSDIEICSKENGGSVTKVTIINGLGTTKTPDGCEVVTTTMYAKISFDIRGLQGKMYNVSKEKSVKVTK